MWTCVSFGSKYRTLTHGEERTPEPQGKGRKSGGGRVTLTQWGGDLARPRSDESANGGLANVGALAPHVAEELVARPHRHDHGTGEDHLGGVEDDVAEGVPRLVRDLPQRQAEGRQRDRLEHCLDLARPRRGHHDLLED